MMMSSTPPSSPSPLAQRLYRFHEEKFKRVHVDLGYGATRLKEHWQRGTPDFWGKKAIGAPLNSLLDIPGRLKTELTALSYTPHFFNATFPHLPLVWSIAMFYVTMIPARLHSEYLRAPTYTDDAGKDKKDYRGMRDVLIRDMLSIGIFLLALAPINEAFRKKMQRDGNMLSFGRDAGVPRMRVMNESLNPLRPWTSKSYDGLEKQYVLSEAPHKLYGITMFDSMNTDVAKVMERKLIQLPASTEENKLRPLRHKLRQLVEVTKLMQAEHTRLGELMDGLRVPNQYEDKHILHSFQKALSVLKELPFEAVDTPQSLHKALFALEAAKRATLAKQLETAGLDIATHKHSSNPALRDAALQAEALLHDGTRKALDAVMGYANNYQKVVSTLAKAKQAKEPQTPAPFVFDSVWKALQGFADTASEMHAIAGINRSLGIRSETEGNHAALAKMSQSFVEAKKQSAKAATLLPEVEALVKEAKGRGVKLGNRFMGLLHMNDFSVYNILAEHAKGLRAPADSMGFVFVACVMGFFPVWLNQVYSEVEFKLKKRAKLKRAKKATSVQSPASSTNLKPSGLTVSG